MIYSCTNALEESSEIFVDIKLIFKDIIFLLYFYHIPLNTLKYLLISININQYQYKRVSINSIYFAKHISSIPNRFSLGISAKAPISINIPEYPLTSYSNTYFHLFQYISTIFQSITCLWRRIQYQLISTSIH